MRLYIDPGTGSMLFTVLLGAVTTLFFFIQKLGIKIKYMARGGKAAAVSKEKIPYVIFSDHKRYWNVFGPLCDAFEERKLPLVYWTCSEDDPVFEKDYRFVKAEYIGEINRAVTRLNMMNARICISTTPGLDVFQWKRSRNTDYYVHIFHSAWDATSYQMFGLDHYDAVLVNGDFKTDQLRKLEKLRALPPKEIRNLGMIYMDAVDARLKEVREKTPATAGPQKDITVLLAPSWGPSSILSRFGEEILQALVATGFRIVVRPHPQSWSSDKAVLDELQQKFPESDRLTWNRDNDNFDILFTSDLMISDFSGVTLDYALVFDKPLIYAQTDHDKATLDAAWLDEEMWIFETLPRIGVPLTKDLFPDMKHVIEDALSAGTLAAGRERARNEAWAHRGESVRLTMDYLVETNERLIQAKEKDAHSATAQEALLSA